MRAPWKTSSCGPPCCGRMTIAGWSIPNSELYTNRVVVNTAHDRRRLAVTVGIGYGDDIGEAKALILGVLAELDGVLQDPPPGVLVTAYGDFSVNLEVRFWIDPPVRREVVEAQDQVLEALKPVLAGCRDSTCRCRPSRCCFRSDGGH